MSSLTQAVAAALPPDNEMVFGIVTAANPLTVSVRGALQNPGTLGSYLPAVGDTVALLRQDATWLCLGSNVSGGTAATLPSVAAYNAAGVVNSTTSATYANVTGITAAFTKRSGASLLRIDLNASLFLTTNPNTRAEFAVVVGLSTLTVAGMLINPVSTHTTISGGGFYAGIPAGTYNPVQLQWLRSSGTGTLSMNTDDWVSMMIAEVA